jgi:hypothetical protein
MQGKNIESINQKSNRIFFFLLFFWKKKKKKFNKTLEMLIEIPHNWRGSSVYCHNAKLQIEDKKKELTDL